MSLLGLSMGATIAAIAASRENDVPNLILWDPVINGAAYMREMLRINLSTQAAVYKKILHNTEALIQMMKDGKTVNVDGYEVGSADDVGQFTSIKVDADGNPHMSYYDTTNTSLMYATWRSGAWQVQTVDGISTPTDAVGQYSSLALHNGLPRVAYYDAGGQRLIDRLKMVVDQLAGIGGGRSLGFGPNRVRSLPDGISQALAEYLSGVDPARFGNGNGHGPNGQYPAESAGHVLPEPASLKIGDLCPECGEASYVNEEGCRKCYSCGHSEC